MKGIIILKYNKEAGPSVDIQYPSNITKKLKIKDDMFISLFEQHKIGRIGPNILDKKIKKKVNAVSFFTGLSSKHYVGDPNHAIVLILSEDDEISNEIEGMLRRIAHELLPRKNEPEINDLLATYYELLEKRELEQFWDVVTEKSEIGNDSPQKEKIVEDSIKGEIFELFNNLESSFKQFGSKTQEAEIERPKPEEFESFEMESAKIEQEEFESFDVESEQQEQEELGTFMEVSKPIEEETDLSDIENYKFKNVDLIIDDSKSMLHESTKIDEHFGELSENDAKEQSNDELLLNIMHLKEQETNLKEEVKILEDQFTEQNMLMEEWNSRIIRLTEDNKNLTEIINNLKTKSGNADAIDNPISDKIGQALELQVLENQISDQSRTLKELKSKNKELEEQNTDLSKTIQELTIKVNKQEIEIHEQKSQTSNTEQIGDISSEQAGFAEKIQVLENQIAKQMKVMLESNAKVSEFKELNENLSETIQELTLKTYQQAEIIEEQKSQIAIGEQKGDISPEQAGSSGETQILEYQIEKQNQMMLESNAQISEFKEQNTSLRETIQELTMKMNQQAKVIDELNIQISKSEQKDDISLDQAGSTEETQILKYQIDEQKRIMIETSAQISEFEEQNTRFIETIQELTMKINKQAKVIYEQKIQISKSEQQGLAPTSEQNGLNKEIRELKEQNASLNGALLELNKKANLYINELDQQKFQIVELKNALKEKEFNDEKDDLIEKLTKEKEDLIMQDQDLSKKLQTQITEILELKKNYEREKKVGDIHLNTITNLKLDIKRVKDEITSGKDKQDDNYEMLIDLKKNLKVLRRERDHYRNIIKENDLL